MAALPAFFSFARAPLIWGLGLAALAAPFAFIDGVLVPPPPDCTDWLWCDHAYAALRFNPSPDLSFLYALIAIPVAFICFLAARIAARGPNPRAHWFMAGPALAILAFSIVNLFAPLLFWVDVDRSNRLAAVTIGQGNALMLGLSAGPPAALITLIAAVAWRFARRAK